jgi:F-type H+-transporting ATPase subunit c
VDLSTILIFAGAGDPTDAGKAVALGVGGGLGAVGAGIGIGIVFGKMIESVARQPELRDELSTLQWLGFALTEACFFYGLVAGLIAFFL